MMRPWRVMMAALILVLATCQTRAEEDARRFKVRLGTCTTSLLGSSEARDENVRLAAEKVNGLVLEPGEKFSFNGIVGERSAKAGFKRASVIINGKLVPQIGGGICQVSSTLYNAVLLADMTVKERHKHSIPIVYLKPGLDATVAWDYFDLKFTNTLDQAVMLKGGLRGTKSKKFVMSVYGARRLPYRVKLESKIEEFKDKKKDGTKVKVFVAEVFRVRKRGSRTLEREFLHRDQYVFEDEADGG